MRNGSRDALMCVWLLFVVEIKSCTVRSPTVLYRLVAPFRVRARAPLCLRAHAAACTTPGALFHAARNEIRPRSAQSAVCPLSAQQISAGELVRAQAGQVRVTRHVHRRDFRGAVWHARVLTLTLSSLWGQFASLVECL